MAKSLKEALLEKFSDLQELGIAPSTTPPQEDEGPAVVVDMASGGRREGGGRRQGSGSASAYDEDLRGSDAPSRARPRPRRGGERGGERPRGSGERFRRGDRAPSAERPAFGDVPPVADRPQPGGRPPAGERPPFASRPPMGDRPRPGVSPGPGPRPGAPQHSVTDRLRQRAEQRRRDEEMRDKLRGLLASKNGGEFDDAAYDKFLNDLTVEVGALPPIERLVEAIELSESLDVEHVGQHIRALYRRRPRPTPLTS